MKSRRPFGKLDMSERNFPNPRMCMERLAMHMVCPNYRVLKASCFAAIILLGVFFRVTHLGTKPYWHDEVYTSLWLSGYDPSQGTIKLFDGREMSPMEMLRYQHVHPRRGLSQTVLTLARNDPQHPPLYYTLAWLWARWCQDSTVGLARSPRASACCCCPRCSGCRPRPFGVGEPPGSAHCSWPSHPFISSTLRKHASTVCGH